MSATSCGRVRHAARLEPPKYDSQENSYCIRCSRFQYGKRVDVCPHCGAQIVSRVSDENMLRMTKFGGSELL